MRAATLRRLERDVIEGVTLQEAAARVGRRVGDNPGEINDWAEGRIGDVLRRASDEHNRREVKARIGRLDIPPHVLRQMQAAQDSR